MRILLQKVSQAQVNIDDEIVGQVGEGYLLFLGVMQCDTEEQADWLARKVSNVRLFDGESGKINDRSILDVRGEILLVSQFTLAGRLDKGNRPDYTQAASPEDAKKLYEYFADALRSIGVSKVEMGRFGAMMQVSLTNEGPVTLQLERCS